MGNDSRSDTGVIVFAGIDVGGTSIKLGLIDGDGNILSQSSFPTEEHRGPADAVDRIANQLERTLNECRPTLRLQDVSAVGLGTPGTMDLRRGVILEPPNLPGWRHYPIRDALSEKLSLPVAYTNDANAAALGEYWIGCGAPYDSMVLLTLGTGVGGGIVINGDILSGATGNAAECGHICVDFASDARICSCGQPGHLEAYASATAVAARARKIASASPESQLARILLKNDEITARDVHVAAAEGDESALAIVLETAEYLARGIATLAHTVDPHLYVLGGAMDFGQTESDVGRRFLARIESLVKQRTFTQVAENLKIEFAKLGSAAGWIGAAGLAKRTYDPAS